MIDNDKACTCTGTLGGVACRTEYDADSLVVTATPPQNFNMLPGTAGNTTGLSNGMLMSAPIGPHEIAAGALDLPAELGADGCVAQSLLNSF